MHPKVYLMFKKHIQAELDVETNKMKILYLKTYNKRKELTTEQRFRMSGPYLNDLSISEERNLMHACSLFSICFDIPSCACTHCFIYNAQGSWFLSKF